MSAIFGILRFDGDEVTERSLRQLSDAMASRRADGSDAVTLGSIGLGHLLVRVTREDALEAQPRFDRDHGLALVADCRLDNREVLADELGIEAAALNLMPDSQLILAAYLQWGEACAEHLLGDFAFALWDARGRKLLLVRDHMGQRPLYYCRTDTLLVFASDRHAVARHRDVPSERLDDATIGRMLTMDRTRRDDSLAIDRITGFGGGSQLLVQGDGRTVLHRYWRPQADPRHEGQDEAYYIDAYRQVLGEAVACRLRRLTAPPGLVFSGGYDSGGIAALAGSVQLPGGKLIAASSVMPADYDGTIRHARPWVERCARVMPWLDVRYVTREGQDSLTGLQARFVARSAPADPYHFVRSALFEVLAGAGVRLAMDGHGGDYTINPRGHLALPTHIRKGEWRRFMSELLAHRRVTGRSWWRILRNDIFAPLMPRRARQLWRRAWRNSVEPWRDRPIDPEFAQTLFAEGQIDPWEARLEGVNSMREQMRVMLDRVASRFDAAGPADAAAHGLELTRPFHDKRVVELGLAIPESLYVKQGRNRYLACAALKDLYPREFQTRSRKNDDEIPDFLRMAKAIEPQLLADIARMEQSESLSRMIDFDKLRALLSAREMDDHESGWEQETQRALSAYLVARYVEWERRDNR